MIRPIHEREGEGENKVVLICGGFMQRQSGHGIELPT